MAGHVDTAGAGRIDLDTAGVYSARLLNTTTHERAFGRWLAAIFAIFVVALFLPWQQFVSGDGVVTALRPQDRPQVVQTVIAGRIEKWFVAEGQFVTRGTPIVQISEIKESFLDPRTVERLGNQVSAKEGAIRAKINTAAALEDQILRLEQGLEFKLREARNKVLQGEFQVQKDSAEVEQALLDSAFASDQARRMEAMYKEGVESLNRYQQFQQRRQTADAKLVGARNQLAKSKNELENATIALGTIEADTREKMAKAESERQKTLSDVQEARADVEKLRQTYTSLEARQGFYRIDAPQDGYVQRAVQAGIGETIKEGDAVVRIVPSSPSQAVELFLKGNDIPLVRTGRRVRLQFEGWPALQFIGWPSVAVGTFGGVITAIDMVESAGGKFRVLVTPDPDDRAWPEQLRMGTRVYGWAMLDEVRVWFELWRQLNGFPPSIRPGDAEPQTLGKPGDAGGK